MCSVCFGFILQVWRPPVKCFPAAPGGSRDPKARLGSVPDDQTFRQIVQSLSQSLEKPDQLV